MSLSVAVQLHWFQYHGGSCSPATVGEPLILFHSTTSDSLSTCETKTYPAEKWQALCNKLPLLWRKVIAILLGKCKVPFINREERMEEGSWASKWKQLAQEEVTSLSTFCKALHICKYPLPPSFCTSAQRKRQDDSMGGGKKRGQRSSCTHNSSTGEEGGTVAAWMDSRGCVQAFQSRQAVGASCRARRGPTEGFLKECEEQKTLASC